jgi:hypothetical protein
MRTVFLTLLTAALALPTLGQSDVDAWRSALAGSWQQVGDAPELRLVIDTTTTEADTLRLHLMGQQAPPGVHRETITCTLHWPAANQLSVTDCPQTTLSRKAPPRDTTLTFHPQSNEGRALQRVAQQFTTNAKQSGDSLSVGTEERFHLVREP